MISNDQKTKEKVDMRNKKDFRQCRRLFSLVWLLGCVVSEGASP
jgi:hypothetical protein